MGISETGYHPLSALIQYIIILRDGATQLSQYMYCRSLGRQFGDLRFEYDDEVAHRGQPCPRSAWT